MTEYKIPKKDDLVKIPEDTVVEALVIEVKIETWKEHVDSETLKKFKEADHDKPQVFVKYNHKEIIRDDAIAFNEEPTTMSKLGKYIMKYDHFPQVGDKVKVDFDVNSKSKIRL